MPSSHHTAVLADTAAPAIATTTVRSAPRSADNRDAEIRESKKKGKVRNGGLK